MAIKIVREGKRKPDIYTGTCPHCGCVIECYSGDMTYEDRPASVGYVPCPMRPCNGRIAPKRKQETPAS